MKIKEIIENLEVISKDFFNNKNFIGAGRVNITIDVLNELTLEANEKEKVSMEEQMEYHIQDLLDCEKFILENLPQGLQKLQVESVLNKMREVIK